MIYEAVRPLLFRLDAEAAHDRALGLLAWCQRSPRRLGWLRRAFGSATAPVRVAGIEFPNPVGLAAGFDKNARVPAALAALGFGFLELGTVTLRPQPGNPAPRVFRYPRARALVNRLGFPNVGVQTFVRALDVTPPAGVPLGINVGKNAPTPLDDAPAEIADVIAALGGRGDFLVLNVSSPNTADLRKLAQPARLERLLDVALAARPRSDQPLFLKLSPDATDEELVAAAGLAAARRVGLIATNTTVDRTGVDAPEAGGLSGAPLRARATAVVRLLRAAVGPALPIIGVGGILSVADAVERLEAGADLVQIYTGLIYLGPSAASTLVRGIAQARRSGGGGGSAIRRA